MKTFCEILFCELNSLTRIKCVEFLQGQSNDWCLQQTLPGRGPQGDTETSLRLITFLLRISSFYLAFWRMNTLPYLETPGNLNPSCPF